MMQDPKLYSKKMIVLPEEIYLSLLAATDTSPRQEVSDDPTFDHLRKMSDNLHRMRKDKENEQEDEADLQPEDDSNLVISNNDEEKNKEKFFMKVGEFAQTRTRDLLKILAQRILKDEKVKVLSEEVKLGPYLTSHLSLIDILQAGIGFEHKINTAWKFEYRGDLVVHLVVAGGFCRVHITLYSAAKVCRLRPSTMSREEH